MTTVDDVRNWIHPALEEVRGTQDQPWDERRARFLALLGVGNPDEHPVLADLFQRLDELGEDERNAFIGSDQADRLIADLAQVHTEVSTAAGGGGYDEAAWQELLTTDGPSWDGTADSWGPFREWFAYRAAERGLTAPATALLDHLDGMPVTERVAVFAQYGVHIGHGAGGDAAAGGELGWVSGEQAAALATSLGPDWQTTLPAELAARWGPDWDTHPTEHKSAWLADLIAAGAFDTAPPVAEGAAAAESEPEEVAVVLDQLAALTAEIPGIEELSDDEVERIISETISQTRTGK